MKHTEAFERLVADVKPRIREISIEEVRAKQQRNEQFYLVDVREDHEWNEGRAKGAQHIGRGVLERDIEKYIPDYNAEIVLYCGGGYRSALAAYSLKQMGYKNAVSLEGGYQAWKTL